MSKINTSLGCNKCLSSNIQYTKEYINEKIEYNSELCAKIYQRQVLYKCKCNDCNNEYIVNHGIERYTLYEKPFSVNCNDDVRLHATYYSQSGFHSSYEICSIRNSTYDQNIEDDIITYFILSERDNYPIVISKEKVNEIVHDKNKAQKLIYNTFQSRYR